MYRLRAGFTVCIDSIETLGESICIAANDRICQQEQRDRIRRAADADLQQDQQLWRDSHMSMIDLQNLRRQRQLQQWRLHDSPSMSCTFGGSVILSGCSAFSSSSRIYTDQILVLGLQSDEQRQWLLQYGIVLIIDSTFSTNNYRVCLQVICNCNFSQTCCAPSCLCSPAIQLHRF